MLSQEQTSLSSAVLSHLASSVPSPRVVSQEREEYERPAREKVDDPEDMPSQIHLRVQRVRSSVCHSDGTIVDGNVLLCTVVETSGELKSKDKHVGGFGVGQPRCGENRRFGKVSACLICEYTC